MVTMVDGGHGKYHRRSDGQDDSASGFFLFSFFSAKPNHAEKIIFSFMTGAITTTTTVK